MVRSPGYAHRSNFVLLPKPCFCSSPTLGRLPTCRDELGAPDLRSPLWHGAADSSRGASATRVRSGAHPRRAVRPHHAPRPPPAVSRRALFRRSLRRTGHARDTTLRESLPGVRLQPGAGVRIPPDGLDYFDGRESGVLALEGTGRPCLHLNATRPIRISCSTPFRAATTSGWYPIWSWYR